MNKELMFSSKSIEWNTPQDVFDKLNEEFHFTLDPCSTDLNHKCAKYYTLKQNGLKQDWKDEVVFINPPYGRNLIEPWVKKSFYSNRDHNTTIVLLLPARTDTKWFHNYIYNKAEIRFIKGRIKFLKNGVENFSAPFPSMIVIFKGDTSGIIRESK